MALVLIGVWTNSFFVSSQMLIDYPLLEQSRFSRIRYFINNDCHCGSVHIGNKKCPFCGIFKFGAWRFVGTYLSIGLWENGMNPKQMVDWALHMFYIHGIAS